MAEDKKNPDMPEPDMQKKVRINWGGTEIEAVVAPDGQLIVPEEMQAVLNMGIDQLKQIAAGPAVSPSVPYAENGQPQTSPVNRANGPAGPAPVDAGVADNFKGLPMRELIANPLLAAAEAQEKLASVAWDFYQKIAYEEDHKTTRLLKFELNRPVVEGGVVSKEGMKQKVEAPFIGLVPIPSLLIDRVDVDFQMEVTDTNSSTDKTDASLSTDISSKWFGVNVGISGKVSSSRESTRSTNQTAKYQVHVSASQQPQTEGLSKLMDIMASCIEPIPTGGGK